LRLPRKNHETHAIFTREQIPGTSMNIQNGGRFGFLKNNGLNKEHLYFAICSLL
jgi:hypothetical protein